MPDNEIRQPVWTVHDLRRGEIIWLLKANYPHFVTFRHLQLALRDRNIPVGTRDLFSYLSYLEESGFVRCERAYCESKMQDMITTSALTAKGMLLYDRKIGDQGVRL